MALPATVLPSTILEFLTAKDPELVREARADAVRLAAMGYECGFDRLEQVPTSFFDLARRRIAKVVGRRGGGADVESSDPVSISDEDHRTLRRYFEEQARQYHLILNFEMAGGRIYRISAGLAQRLLQTRIDVTTEALQLPFRSLMLVFDDDDSLAAFHQDRPFGRSPLRGAVSSILFDARTDAGRCLLATSIHTNGSRAYGMMERSMRYREGTLEGMISTQWEGANDSLLRTSGKDFHRLILNSILYISSQSSRIAVPRRNASAPDPLTRSVRAFMPTGEGLTPLSRGARGIPSSKDRLRGRPVDVRQIVSGHWKYQAYGTRLSERKLVWIEPYWRGPDFAEVVNRPKLVR